MEWLLLLLAIVALVVVARWHLANRVWTPRHSEAFSGALLRLVLDRLDGIAPGRVIRLGAQKHLEAFYARFGFRRISDVYDDGGIPHVDMERT